jgi:hypothetical protein
MAALFSTLAIAFIVILVAIGLLAIGWLVTGKAKICAGSCGRDPNIRKKECGNSENVSCHLCDKSESNEKK